MELIKKLDLTNCILTVGALNTKKEIITAIKFVKGDYVLALKKNQKTFYKDVREYLDDLVALKEIRNVFKLLNTTDDIAKLLEKIYDLKFQAFSLKFLFLILYSLEKVAF